MTKHKVIKGVVHAKKGIPQSPRWFADSRLSFEMDEKGITQVDYRVPLKIKNIATLFLRRLWDGFRYYIEDNKYTYKPEFTETKMWPFGISGQWEHKGAIFEHSVMAIDECMVFSMKALTDVPEGIKFKFEFYDNFALVTSDVHDFRYNDQGSKRFWNNWEFDSKNNALTGGYFTKPDKKVIDEKITEDIDIKEQMNNAQIDEHEEDKDYRVDICFTGDFTISHNEKPSIKGPGERKQIFRSPDLKKGQQVNIVISFGTGKAAVCEKAQKLTANIENRIAAQFARYEEVARKSPVLKSSYKGLNDYLALAPMHLEALKINDIKGATRAKTSDFWVWGWDGMTNNQSSLYYGNADFIKDMLAFYESKAHPELGIGHMYRNDMSVRLICSVPSQGIYIVLLQLYYDLTGDIETLKARYPFARKIFNLILNKEVKGTGLCEGSSLFPDYPMYMKENGSDISALNNTIFYSAARAVEHMAVIVGDLETENAAEKVFKNIETNFMKLFFDEEKKFIVNSVDAHSLKKRACYNAGAVKWESSYLRELLEPVNEKCMEFYEEHIVSDAGLRVFPVWDDAFDGDANQLHGWWPVVGEYFLRLSNLCGRKDMLDKYAGWISYWINKIMCPEGISYYFETDKPETDSWATLNATWNAFSVRTWYQGIIHGIVGVDIEAGGMTFYPYEGEEMTLKGLHFGDKIFDIEMKGSGRYIETISVGDKQYKGTNKLPSEAYNGKKKVKVSICRTKERSCDVSIKYGYGLEITNYQYEAGKITAHCIGAGTCRLTLDSKKTPRVKIDGVPMEVRYDAVKQSATIEMKLRPGEVKVLVVEP